MKYGVIDVGSNSIRLMINENGQTLQKTIKTTQIAEGLATQGTLSERGMNESAQAISKFYKTAQNQGADKIFVFGTEALRSAENAKDFIERMVNEFNINIDVLNGDQEALAGFYGAYRKDTDCVVDIGGASTEIIIGNNEGIKYKKSLPIGVVRLKDLCGDNEENLNGYIKGFLSGFKVNDDFDELIGIGGTPSTVVSMIEKMEKYNPDKVHNYKLTRKAIKEMFDYVSSIPVKERYTISGLPEKKINVICGGMLLLINILDMLKRPFMIVSEKDNMEGYLMIKNLIGNDYIQNIN